MTWTTSSEAPSKKEKEPLKHDAAEVKQRHANLPEKYKTKRKSA